MSESTIKRMIVGFCLAAVVVSAYILAVDNALWTYNPGHAYGLIAFMVVDLILIGLVFLRWRLARYFMMLWGGLQVALLVGDAATGLGLGADTGYSFKYLFLGEGNPSGLSTTVLLVLYVLVGLLALYEVVKVRRSAPGPQESVASSR